MSERATISAAKFLRLLRREIMGLHEARPSSEDSDKYLKKTIVC